MKNAEQKNSEISVLESRMNHAEKVYHVASKSEKAKISKASAKKALKQSENALSDSELIALELEKLNVSAYVDKAVTSRNIWKVEFLRSLSESDKTARRKARNNFQIPLSQSVVNKKNNKFTKTATLNELCNKLKAFYNLSLKDFSKYSSMSETGKHYKDIHSAYSIMKTELKLK